MGKGAPGAAGEISCRYKAELTNSVNTKSVKESTEKSPRDPFREEG